MKKTIYCLVTLCLLFFACTPQPQLTYYEQIATDQLENLSRDAKTGLIPEGLSMGDPMLLSATTSQFEEMRKIARKQITDSLKVKNVSNDMILDFLLQHEYGPVLCYTVFPEYKLLKGKFFQLPPCLQARLMKNQTTYVFYNPTSLSGYREYQKLPLPGKEEDPKSSAIETKPAP